MASFTKKALVNISRSLPKEHHRSLQSLLSRVCFSTSYQHVQDPRIEDKQSERDVQIDNMSGVTGFAADTVRQAAAKTTEMAEDFIDMAKMVDSSAYDNSNNSTQKLEDTLVAKADENVVDTSEYRNIEEQFKYADDHDEHNHRGWKAV